MSGQQTRTLTEAQVEALKRALATARVHMKNQSHTVDGATDEPEILDPLHSSYAKEQEIWRELQEVLDDADEVVIHPRDMP